MNSWYYVNLYISTGIAVAFILVGFALFKNWTSFKYDSQYRLACACSLIIITVSWPAWILAYFCDCIWVVCHKLRKKIRKRHDV